MKTIPLYGAWGRVTLVSDEDFSYLSSFRWHLCQGYARTWRGGGFLQMAWVVGTRMGLTLGIGDEYDHADRDPLNNQRSNLRVFSRSLQNKNRIILPRFISSYVSAN